MFPSTKSDLNPQKNIQEEVYHTSKLWRFDKRCKRYSGGLVALLFCATFYA